MVSEGDDFVVRNAIGDLTTAEEAFRDFDARIESTKDAKVKANLLLGKAVLCGVLRRFGDARKQLGLALEQAPDDPDIRLQFEFVGGSLYDQEGKPGEAYPRLTAILSEHSERLAQPDVRFMYEDIQQRRGLELARMERYQDAVPLLKESLSFELKPEDRSDVLANLGLCYLELREFELAKDHFLQAAALGLTKEWEGQVHFGLGVTYFYTGQLREAKREFQTSEERAVEYQLPILGIYGWLSSICKRLGEASESERYARLARPS